MSLDIACENFKIQYEKIKRLERMGNASPRLDEQEVNRRYKEMSKQTYQKKKNR